MVEDRIISLNIGGSNYQTLASTLSLHENSVLAKCGSGDSGKEKNGIIKVDEDSYFIDRDGALFSYVLDYLRSGTLRLPDSFTDHSRLRTEAEYYKLPELVRKLSRQSRGELISSPSSKGGSHITIAYRGSLSLGKDNQMFQHDVKFRKLQRILVCGHLSVCQEIFGETLNESRDAEKGTNERYTSRLYLKHNNLELAFDTLSAQGFNMIASSASGGSNFVEGQSCRKDRESASGSGRLGADVEEQRWNHFKEYVFFRQ